ncbi:MAG: AI-2E family transporter [Patescibacteria group bacterium]|nr:AI-2E family transporter [Patescibacteria group bacterium]
MASRLRTWTARDVVTTTLVVAAVGLGFWLAYHVVFALALLFIALVLATAMRNAVAGLEWLGFPRTLAAMTAHLTVLALLVAVAVVALPRLVDQTVGLLEVLPDHYESLRFQLVASSSHVLQAVGRVLPKQPWRDLFEGAQERPSEFLPAWSQLLFPGLALLFSLLATFLLSFHWCIAGEKTTHSLLFLLPAGRRQEVADCLGDIQHKLGAFVQGQLVLCGTVGTMAYVAYLAIGVPFAAVLAVVAGALEAVPVIGPIVATVPAVIVAAPQGWQTVLWVIAANVVIAQIESYLLVPSIMNRSVGVHPIVSIAAIAAMLALMGPIGGVLAIPSAAVVQTLLNRLVFRRAPKPDARVQNDRNPAAVVRYRGEELLHDVRTLAIDPPVCSGTSAISADEILEQSELVVEEVLEDLHARSQQTPSSASGNSSETGATHSTAAQVARIAMVAGATLAMLTVLWAFRSAVALLIMAIVLSWAMRPFQARLPSRRLIRLPAIFAMYLGLLVVPAVAGYYVVPLIAANMEQAVRQLAKLHQELPRRWAEGTTLQQIAATRIARMDGTLADEPAGHTVALFDGALGWGGTLSVMSINLLFVLFLAGYWSVDGDRFRRLWLSLLSGWRRRQATRAWQEVELEVGAFVRRELLLALLAAAGVGFSLGAIGFPFATALALITLAAWFVPWLGVALALLAVWVAVGINSLVLTPVAALAQGLIGSAVVLAVHAVLSTFVRPRILQRTHVHAMWIVVMAVSLVVLLGWWGLLLAPPVAVASQAAFRSFRHTLSHVDDALPGDLANARARFNKLCARVIESDWAENAPIKTAIQRVDTLLTEAEDLHASTDHSSPADSSA